MLKRPMCLIGLAVVLVTYLLMCIIKMPVPEQRAGIKEKQSICLTGQVTRKEQKNDKSVVYLKEVHIKEISEISTLSETYSIIVYLEDDTQVKLGSIIAIEGRCSLFDAAENEGQFDAAHYYETNGIDFAVTKARVIAVSADHDVCREALHMCRERMKAVYDRYLPKKEAGILHALLLGDKTSLDADIKELYMRAGIVHILSLSGLHIATAGLCLLSLLRRLRMGLLPASILSAFVILQYGLMTGLQTSTFRALIMFLLSVLALCIGRTYDMLSAMSLAAILLLMENPMYLYHTGFLLSFGAVMGIGLIYPCLMVMVPQKLYRKKMIQSLLVSLAVQLATLPIVLCSYYQISICGILLNLVVVPLMTFVLALGILGGMFGMLADIFGIVLLYPCRLILMLYEWLSELATQAPGSVLITGKPAMWRAVVYYILLFAMLVFLSYVKAKHKHDKCQYIGKVRIVCLTVMLTIITILVVRHEEQFAITMLSVGQGECTVLHGRNTPTIVIDGGSTDVKEVGKYRIIPYLKANRLHRIDTAFISHTDTDHISGILEILQSPESGIRIKRLVLPAINKELQNEHYQKLIIAAADVGTSVYTMGTGDRYRTVPDKNGQAVSLTCLHPGQSAADGDISEDINENSMVLHVSYVNLSVLFTGDISSEVERDLLSAVPDCDILKVPHHGSRYSSSEVFLEAVRPELALISAGKDNSYGHPHLETIERLEKAGSKILRTDKYGAVTLVTDGEQMTASGYKMSD